MGRVAVTPWLTGLVLSVWYMFWTFTGHLESRFQISPGLWDICRPCWYVDSSIQDNLFLVLCISYPQSHSWLLIISIVFSFLPPKSLCNLKLRKGSDVCLSWSLTGTSSSFLDKVLSWPFLDLASWTKSRIKHKTKAGGCLKSSPILQLAPYTLPSL